MPGTAIARVSNALFYNLPRHSNHHMFAGRRAWELTALDDAPMLPYGYKTMLLVALVPPLFRRLHRPAAGRMGPHAGERCRAGADPRPRLGDRAAAPGGRRGRKGARPRATRRTVAAARSILPFLQ